MKTKLFIGLLLWATVALAQPSTPSNPNSCPPNKDLGCNPATIPIPDTIVTVNPGKGGCKVVKRQLLNEVKVQNGCSITLTRVYAVFTTCGNVYSCVQEIKWKEDKTPPIIYCPKDTAIVCPPRLGLVGNVGDPAVPAAIAPLAIDNCDGLLVGKFDKDSVIKIDCQTIIYRRYKATDKCGNTSYCIQKISIYRDYIDPKIKCPKDWYLGCTTIGRDGYPQPIESAFGTDNCELHNLMYFDGDLNDNPIVVGCLATHIRLWIVTDRCGNQAQCEQKIQWTIDSQGPEIKYCGSDINYGCLRENPLLPLPDTGVIIAMDNCGGNLKKLVLVDTTVTNGCMFLVKHTYIVADACGRVTRCIREFRWKIISGSLVSIPFPDDTKYFCTMPDLDLKPPVNNVCNVGTPVIVKVDTFGNCPIKCTLEVTWRKYDCFGNYTDHKQIIQIECEIAGDGIQAPTKKLEARWNSTGIKNWTILFDAPVQNARMYVVDIYGRVINTKKLAAGSKTTTLDLSDLSPGIYFVHLQDGLFIQNKKLLISQ